jgi:PAS domain S-box-containing protein
MRLCFLVFFIFIISLSKEEASILITNNVPPKNKIGFRFSTSDETVKALFKNIPIPTFVWQKKDKDFILVDYNDAALEITKRKIARLLGAKIEELSPDIPEVKQELLQCFTQKTTLAIEKLYQFKTTGETKHFSVKYVFVPPDLILVYSEDITPCKETENKLNDSEKRYRELANLLPQTIYETDADYNITYSNQAGFESFGYTQEDLQKGLNIVEIIIPEEREKAIQNIQKVIKGENLGGNEYTALRKDGTTFPVNAYSSPIIRKEKVIGLRGIVVDISKLKEAQTVLKQAHDELEQRVRERTAKLSETNKNLETDIAECKQIESVFRDRERFIRSILNALFVNIAILNDKGEIVYVNEPWIDFARNNGLDSDLVGKNYLSVCDSAKGLWGNEALVVSANIRKVISGEIDCFSIEYPCHSTQERRWFKMSVTRFIEPGPVYVVVAHENITDLKLTEEALRHSERRYRHIVEDQTDLICRHLPDGTVSFVNDAYCRFLNKNREEIVGKINLPSVTDEGFEVILKQRSSLTLKKPITSYEHKMIRFDRKIRWFHRTDRAIFDENEVIQEYQSVARDITARKRTEEELEKYRFHLEDLVEERTQTLKITNQKLNKELIERKRTELALQLSKRRYELLYEENPSMYFTIDLKGKILSVNKFGAAQLGYSVKELIGKSVYTIIYKEDTKIVQHHLQDICADIKKVDSWEFRKVHKDGRIIWVKESARRINDDDGKSLILIVCEDITDRIKAQNDREKLIKELSEREKLAILGQFTAVITHEINNPLDIIITQIDGLKDDYYHLPELLTYVEKIKEQVLRINRLARDILSYAKPHFPELYPVDVNKVLVQTIELLQGYHRDRIKIETKLKPNLPLIAADAIGLEIVFKNIILNAIQSIKQEGTINIATQLTKENQLRINIKDNGAGIEKWRIKNIFEQFHTSKRDAGGNGLGLAISLEIVKKHHGTINVKSRLGEGTAFRVNLPIRSTA